MSPAPVQSGLFPDLAPSVSPCFRVEPRRRGRGATPVTHLTWTAPEPGPTGRKTLVYEFRILKEFQDPLEDPANADRRPIYAVACNLIAEYFHVVGGFRTATDHVVNAWCRAVRKYGVAAVRAALHAKAASLRADAKQTAREKRIYICRPDRFAEPEILEGWIAQTEGVPAPEPEGQRLLRAARLRDRLNSIRRPGGSASQISNLQSPSASSAVDPLTHRLALAARDAAHNRTLWSRLTDVQRRTIERVGYPVFDEQVRDLAGPAADPHDVRFDDWQLEVFVGLALQRFPTQILPAGGA